LGSWIKHHEPGLALDERRDRAHVFAEDQVSFPVTRYGTIVGLNRAFADVDRATQLALAVHHRVAERSPVGAARPQEPGQFLAESALGLHEQRQVDRLVRHAHLRVVGEVLAEPAGDLGR
jgi:hypothetical protein